MSTFSLPTTMADDHYFPDEILISILKHLPSKTIIKCLTVSKSWYSLIKSPNFISTHLNHHKSNPNHLLFHESNFRHSICHLNQPMAHPTPLTTPTIGSHHFTSVAGSHNGVVCLCTNTNGALCLWNPSINKHLIINPIPNWDNNLTLGFGFDSAHNDHKIIAITIIKDTTTTTNNNNNSIPQIHLYSLKSNTWKTTIPFPSSDDFPGEFGYFSEGCFVHGFVYWILIRMVQPVEEEMYAGVILTFDMRNECFGELELPPVVGDVADPDLMLAVINDELGLLQIFNGESIICVVWQMNEEECWRVMYRINLNDRICKTLGSCGVWEGKGFIVTCSGSLIAFEEERLSTTDVVDGQIVSMSGQAFRYSESLVLLDQFGDAGDHNSRIQEVEGCD